MAPRRGKFAGLKLSASRKHARSGAGARGRDDGESGSRPGRRRAATDWHAGWPGMCARGRTRRGWRKPGCRCCRTRSWRWSRRARRWSRKGSAWPEIPRRALARSPGLAAAAATGQVLEVAELRLAVGQERQGRLALEERGRATVRAWDKLERAYEAAGKSYDWDAQREVGTRIEAFAKALKRDRQLDRLLRERGHELGIAPRVAARPGGPGASGRPGC